MCHGYFHFFTLVVILTLSSINQVSAVKCYDCDSHIDKDCTDNPKQTKFIVDCSHHSFLPTSEKQDNQAAGVEYNCGYARGVSTIDSEIRVRRGCAVKSTTCETYSRIYKADHNIELKECTRCESDFCNSSGHLSTGIWSLSLSLIALYIFKL
ncbi:uncharacterized protein LOC131667839 [Phymastichus coffea]|uniref:uncharacterized protein LOC131667839 n=1 Tax=Phymastichus coffea TaxID=108790 RepID=UPI00273B026D|nr:uncharacterized protein LOC131667839 [Phymastichus coffea]